MQAALDGKEIELDDGNGWRLSFVPKNHAWDWANYDYRIKQQPMEFWVNVYRGGYIGIGHETEKQAVDINEDNIIKTIKVREVT